MYKYKILTCFFLILASFIETLLTISNSSLNSEYTAWVSSNFGSSFSINPYAYDFNQDGLLDMMLVSVDGEVVIYNMDNDLSILNPNWPFYLSNDHFFSQPRIYIHGMKKNEESIIVLSQQGRIYVFHSMGYLLESFKLPNLYIDKDWQKKHAADLTSLVNLDKRYFDKSEELKSEIYSDFEILDLTNEGILNDLLIPVNYVSKTVDSHDSKLIVPGIIVFTFHSKKVVHFYPLNISQMKSEYPEFLLNNFEILKTVKTYQLIVTLASGLIYQLEWSRKQQTFLQKFGQPLTYNHGPNQCQLQLYCGKENNDDNIRDNQICCTYADYYGHFALFDLNQRKTIWEYEFSEDSGIPTSSKYFVNSHEHDGSIEFYNIFATSNGWIHVVKLANGKSASMFPVQIKRLSFKTAPEILTDTSNQMHIILLSEEGAIVKVPFQKPNDWQILVENSDLVSYVPPKFIHSIGSRYSSVMVILSKSGFIHKYDIPNLRIYEHRLVKGSSAKSNSLSVPVIYAHGSVFSLDLSIIDSSAALIKNKHRNFYLIDVFINEYSYLSHKEFHSGDHRTNFQLSIDMNSLNTSLAPPSVYLFGTISLFVRDSDGHNFPVEYLRIRLNYDFQFELIWILYLTFGISVFSMIFFTIFVNTDKGLLPVHNTPASVN